MAIANPAYLGTLLIELLKSIHTGVRLAPVFSAIHHAIIHQYGRPQEAAKKEGLHSRDWWIRGARKQTSFAGIGLVCVTRVNWRVRRKTSGNTCFRCERREWKGSVEREEGCRRCYLDRGAGCSGPFTRDTTGVQTRLAVAIFPRRIPQI